MDAAEAGLVGLAESALRLGHVNLTDSLISNFPRREL